jgi:hypothetical protein
VEDVLSPPTKNNGKKFDDCLRNEGYLQFDGLSRVGAPVNVWGRQESVWGCSLVFVPWISFEFDY